jgi:hypothetical protein
MINPTECTVPGTGVFDLAVVVTAFPSGGYPAIALDYDWTGTTLAYEERATELEIPWPDRDFIFTGKTFISPTRVQFGDFSTNAGSTPSMFKGDVAELRFHCPMMPSTNVISLLPSSAANPGGTAVPDTGGTIYPQADSITINCALPSLDTDNDGCTDLREMGTNQMWGGRRNPTNFWDFYDVPDFNNMRDRVVTTTGDILRVARRFGANDMMGIAAVNRNSDPLAGPIPPFPSYHPAFDRGPAPMGADLWDMTPPDGFITVMTDVLGVVRQMAHNCLN